MAEYINREEALMWFKAYLHTGDDSIPTDTVLSDLRYVIPKVDVAPVRHSYWESYDTSACIGTDDTIGYRTSAGYHSGADGRRC